MLDKIDTDKVKKIGVIALGVIALFMLGIGIFLFVQNQSAKEIKESPITKLEVTNDKVYKITDTMKASDFTVKAVHKNGKSTKIDSNDIQLSRNDIAKIGKETNVTLSLKSDKNITYDASVAIERTKIVSFQCGYPKVADVVATLYSNGELAFEGKGDMLIFANYEYPWFNYEEMDDHPITAVSFGADVTPTNLNYYFKGIETLTDIAPIPISVQTMIGTFSECTSLKTCADWSKCDALLDISHVYEGCTSLTKTYPVPKSVKKATSAYSSCSALYEATDMSEAKSLLDSEDMFANCISLSKANLAPNVKKIDGMYQSCINLKSMPKISNSVESMNETFSGDLSLENVTDIPKGVKAFDSCFVDCEMIKGTMKIDCDVTEASSLFSGAAVVTNLNLKGKSYLLDMYANTCDSKNITVNGKKANEALTSSSDYEKETTETTTAVETQAKTKKSTQQKDTKKSPQIKKKGTKASKKTKETQKETKGKEAKS